MMAIEKVLAEPKLRTRDLKGTADTAAAGKAIAEALAQSRRAALTLGQQLVNTVASALTGRHRPAAREESHLFGLSRLLCTFFQPGISGSQAIHERRSP
jgi:hypothetical protein